METEGSEVITAATQSEVKETMSGMKNMNFMKRLCQTMKANKKTLIAVLVSVLVIGIVYSSRGFFIAVTVNGSPISRWSVIRELEKKSGEQALDTMITKKLIDTEAAKAGIVVSFTDIDKEMATITEQVSKQGGTLALALEQQGMTEGDLREQIIFQKELEGILKDEVMVTDEDVASYMTENKAVTPKGMTEDDFKNQIREQLKGQKFNAAASKWIADAKAQAKVDYFVDYAPKPLLIEELPAEAMSSELKQ